MNTDLAFLQLDTDTMHRFAALVIALSLAVACTPSEEAGREQPPARELQAFSPDENTPDLDAPTPEVRRAVRSAALEVEEGAATFYADELEGRPTASGRTFRQADMVAAHRAYPFGTRLRVTNLSNDRSVEVEVVDRGPFGHEGSAPAVLDLSRAAAERLGFVDAGRAKVRVEVLEWGG